MLREVDRVGGMLRRARRDMLVVDLSFRWVVEIVSCVGQSRLMIRCVGRDMDCNVK